MGLFIHSFREAGVFENISALEQWPQTNVNSRRYSDMGKIFTEKQRNDERILKQKILKFFQEHLIFTTNQNIHVFDRNYFMSRENEKFPAGEFP